MPCCQPFSPSTLAASVVYFKVLFHSFGPNKGLLLSSQLKGNRVFQIPGPREVVVWGILACKILATACPSFFCLPTMVSPQQFDIHQIPRARMVILASRHLSTYRAVGSTYK